MIKNRKQEVWAQGVPVLQNDNNNKKYVSRHSTMHVRSSRLVTEFSKISEFHRLFVIYIVVVCFVFKWWGDHVKAETFQGLRTFFHWSREGIYKSTKCKNVVSLIEIRDRWRLQAYEFFAIIRSLWSVNLSKHSVIDWQKSHVNYKSTNFLR